MSAILCRLMSKYTKYEPLTSQKVVCKVATIKFGLQFFNSNNTISHNIDSCKMVNIVALFPNAWQ